MERIKEYLRNNEKIVWTGKPDEKRILKTNDIFIVPLGIAFFVFILLWEVSEILSLVNSNNSFSITLVYIVLGVPVIFAGIYLSVLRLIFRKREKERTVYVVTDKRILIVNEDSNEVLEFNISPNLNMNKSIDGNGYGTLKFYPISIYHKILNDTGMDESSWFTNNTDAPTFSDLHDADKVYDIITNIKSIMKN